MIWNILLLLATIVMGAISLAILYWILTVAMLFV